MYLTSIEMARQAEETRMRGGRVLALVPVGCTEQHGPFLPLETDSLIAEGMARALCEKIEEEFARGYVFPGLSYSPTRTNAGFAGTVSISEDCFRGVLLEVGRGILHSGFDGLIFVSGHGPADPSLKEIACRLVHDQFSSGSVSAVHPVLVLSLFEQSLNMESSQKPGLHADWREFLLLYHLLGDSFFDEKRMREMRKFMEQHDFAFSPSCIPGIPLEHRSVRGVIGEPLPGGTENPGRLAEEFWEKLLLSLHESLGQELGNFFSKWPGLPECRGKNEKRVLGTEK